MDDSTTIWKKKLALYEVAVQGCPRFDRMGKTMPHTSANGYMFSQLNKQAELGIRFSPDIQRKYIQEWNSDYFRSYGEVMKGYVRIPEVMWADPEKLSDLLNESYDYVMSLEPK